VARVAPAGGHGGGTVVAGVGSGSGVVDGPNGGAVFWSVRSGWASLARWSTQ
jgi:hypothetical protein